MLTFVLLSVLLTDIRATYRVFDVVVIVWGRGAMSNEAIFADAQFVFVSGFS